MLDLREVEVEDVEPIVLLGRPKPDVATHPAGPDERRVQAVQRDVPDLDRERGRDEIARITNGYSPAMIEQVCSMALTYAHAEGRMSFGWVDLVEAMTTIESGTALQIEYVPEETRATAIHEAGHAVASHVYREGDESTRLSIRMRGNSLGHHQKEERFSAWRSEEFATLIHVLGAMAAERVFYGENSVGVGGDVRMATRLAAYMVGVCRMGPEPLDLAGKVPAGDVEQREEELMKRFEKIAGRASRRSPTSSSRGASSMATRSHSCR